MIRKEAPIVPLRRKCPAAALCLGYETLSSPQVRDHECSSGYSSR